MDEAGIVDHQASEREIELHCAWTTRSTATTAVYQSLATFILPAVTRSGVVALTGDRTTHVHINVHVYKHAYIFYRFYNEQLYFISKW